LDEPFIELLVRLKVKVELDLVGATWHELVDNGPGDHVGLNFV
jgi:hypothetical protein